VALALALARAFEIEVLAWRDMVALLLLALLVLLTAREPRGRIPPEIGW
jgi:hypothetical protein